MSKYTTTIKVLKDNNFNFGLDIKIDINRSSAEEFGLLTNDIGVEDNNG